MPLEIPNLDDRTWADLVEEARSLIPRVAPLWTDHNVHDPGITFIELFAWLAEMQLYQVNRVGQKHRETFARLAGLEREQSKPARVRIRLDGNPNVSRFLPAGTQVAPLEGEELIFETDVDLFVTRSWLQQVVTDDGSGPLDQTNANEKPGIAFLAFGENAREGAELRLRFDEFYPEAEPEIRLTASVFTDDLVERCAAVERLKETDDGTPPVNVELAWEFLATADRWSPLEVLDDESANLSRSGAVTLSVPPKGARWIRARIQRGFYDIEPRLTGISLNVLPCSQKQTVHDEQLGEGNGKPDQSFELQKKPVLVPKRDLHGPVTSSDVVDWDHVAKQLEKSAPNVAVPSRSFVSSAVTDDLSAYRRIKELNRLLVEEPEEIKTAAHLLGATPVVIEVDDEPWRLVSSFESSGPDNKDYVFDSNSGRVEFGNGLNGQVPQPQQPVRAIWYQASSGSRGNVARDLKWRFVDAVVPGVTLTNREAGSNGTDPEPLDELKLRVQADLNRPQRAVTLKDIELLALSTPHAYVARTKAITNCPVPESISVVAVPKIRPGRKGPPRPPSRPFLDAVQQNLQQRRLLGDNLRVIGPVYIEIRISAKLRLEKGAGADAVITRAREALDRFLSGELTPSDQKQQAGNRDSVRKAALASACPSRWPFGRSVFPSEVYAILDGVAGVDFASNVVLTASRDGKPVAADSTGAIPVPQVGLVFAGPHDLTVDADVRRNG